MIFTRNGVKLLKQTRCGVKIKWKTRHQHHWKYVRTSGVAKARRAVRELAACKTLASSAFVLGRESYHKRGCCSAGLAYTLTEPSGNATPPAIDACGRGCAALKATTPWRLQTKATPTPPRR